jgi:hypothetical protein
MGTEWSNCWRRIFLTSAVIIIMALVFVGMMGIKPVHASSPPSPPENLTATAVSSTQIYLRWDDKSDNEIRFVIERKTGKGGYFPVNIVGSNTTSYTDTGLNPDAVYNYRVKAHGSAGDSEYSNEATITALSLPLEPPLLLSPSNGSIVTTLTPQMKWVPAEDEVTYILEIATDSGFSGSKLRKTDIEEAGYTVPESILKWNSSYYWRIRCEDESGTLSEWSAHVYFRLFPRSFGIHYCNCH